jgi:hypothetical protein
MLIAKNILVFLLDEEAIMHSAYLCNCAPTCALKGKTLYETWTGKKPDVSLSENLGVMYGFWMRAKISLSSV